MTRRTRRALPHPRYAPQNRKSHQSPFLEALERLGSIAQKDKVMANLSAVRSCAIAIAHGDALAQKETPELMLGRLLVVYPTTAVGPARPLGTPNA